MAIPTEKMKINKLPEKFEFIYNYGNVGDAVITYGTKCLFNRLNSELKDAEELPVVFVGSGNIGPYYSDLIDKLNMVSRNREVIILPSSSLGHWDFLKEFSNLTLYCRDIYTYEIALKNNIKAIVKDDCAFEIDYSVYNNQVSKNCNNVLENFRTDKESLNNTPISDQNWDISATKVREWKINCSKTYANWFIMKINTFNKVITDRLHVGIVATLLGKETILYPNGYHKNKGVYETSLSKYNNIKFMYDYE